MSGRWPRASWLCLALTSQRRRRRRRLSPAAWAAQLLRAAPSLRFVPPRLLKEGLPRLPRGRAVSPPFLSLPFLRRHTRDARVRRRQGRLCQAPGPRLGPLLLPGAMSEQTGLALPQTMDRYGEGPALGPSGREPSGWPPEGPRLSRAARGGGSALPVACFGPAGRGGSWGGQLRRGAPAAVAGGGPRRGGGGARPGPVAGVRGHLLASGSFGGPGEVVRALS